MNYETEFEALDCLIASSKRTYKEVAHHIYPHLRVDSAYSRLKLCLNPDKEDKLSLGEILAICRFCERYDILMYLADECGFKRPEPKPKEDFASELRKDCLKMKEFFEQMAEKMERFSPISI